ncbi:MAG: polysaccharide biosynthesis protein [Anoxybacillus mongoliensis]|nr:polysaccharide biosynthesis protein [Anoxybacillus mongoliensis]
MKRRDWLHGAFVLTVAALFTKILSAFYRIPYQNIAGDVGFYIYQQVYPFYGIFTALSTYGYPVAISKLIAENKQSTYTFAVVRLSFYFLSCMSVIMFSILYFGSSSLATVMGDHQLVSLIRAISFAFLLLPFASVFRGYFQGIGEMVPTAVSQVVEQFVRVFAILFLSSLLLHRGFNVYEAGAGAMIGSLMGSFAALAVLVAYMLRKRMNVHTRLWLPIKEKRRVLLFLAVHGVTICLANMVLVLMQLVDSLTLLPLLQQGGWHELAKTAKGIYDRGQPFIQLGTVAATSFSLALVPMLSSEQKERNAVYTAVRLAFVIGMGAAVGLVCILKQANMMLFEDHVGAIELTILSISILFTSLTLTFIAILQGLGDVFRPLFVVCIGMIAKWVLNVMFVPLWHTVGAAVATFIAYVVMCTIAFFYVQKRMSRPLLSRSIIIQTIKAAAMMAIVLAGYIILTNELPVHQGRLFSSFQAIIGVFIGAFVYIIMIVKEEVFAENELLAFPFGRYLINIKQRKAG